jgi:phosphatidylserine decarboxylase
MADTLLLQVKGFPYALDELLCDRALAAGYRHGRYVTPRLTAGMHHRFHAPHDCRVEQVTHIAGDVWNVNPATLKRIEKVYCKNQRAGGLSIRARTSPSPHPSRGGHRQGVPSNHRFARLPEDPKNAVECPQPGSPRRQRG